jgi:ATP-dependent Lon protease
MTGELTLTGRVLPIGGLKEKVLGAVRAGITEIILPKDNEADLEDLPADVREHMKFHLSETLDDVIQVALEDGDGRRSPDGQRPQETGETASKRKLLRRRKSD